MEKTHVIDESDNTYKLSEPFSNAVVKTTKYTLFWGKTIS